MSPRPAFASVAQYVAALEPGQAKALKTVLALVRKTVPDAKAVISYGIPAFSSGKVFIYCAAFKRHIGIYPPVTRDAALRRSLEPYANAKGNLSFPLDAPLPLDLIARVIEALRTQYAQPEATPATRNSRPATKPRRT